MTYFHVELEKKWLAYWQKINLNAFSFDTNKPKYYVLAMFPYPSGAGLHLGHVKSYLPTDVIARYKRYLGYNVLYPMGWDAFGLPTEQFAIQTKKNPNTFTQKNIARFKQQIDELGFCFATNIEINTTNPLYYAQTQWLFNKFLLHDLAFQKKTRVNWCEGLQTVLANEEVMVDANGHRVSERGSFVVTYKVMRQWMLRITFYAQRLLDDLVLLDWPQSLKAIQTKWIGLQKGYLVGFLLSKQQNLAVFVQNAAVLAQISYIALSPNHALVLAQSQNNPDLNAFINQTNQQTYLLAFQAQNPYTQQNHQLIVCKDLVYDDVAIAVIEPKNNTKPTDAKLIHQFLAHKNNIKPHTIYQLKDWVFARQRYWGEPFPVFYDANNNLYWETNLPLKLPYMATITPSKSGEGPLKNLASWASFQFHNKTYWRETNTMPQWAGSSWYYLAYLLVDLNQKDTMFALDSSTAQKRFQTWLPVDLYIGGQEHAVLHLLYARFWHKFLYDLNLVPTPEPFIKVVNQGMVLASDGSKMSKSKNNTINPSDIILQYGADALRLYIAFAAPINASLSWNEQQIKSMYKWIKRVWRLFHQVQIISTNNPLLTAAYERLVNVATANIAQLQLNLAISELMVFVNVCYKCSSLNPTYLRGFLVILSCFAPFVSEALYQSFVKTKASVFEHKWPKVSVVKQTNTTLPVQINGKVKEVITVRTNSSIQEVLTTVFAIPKIQKYLLDNQIVEQIYVPNKILNLLCVQKNISEEHAMLKLRNVIKILQNEELLRILCDFVVLKTNKLHFNYFLKTIESWADKGIITIAKAKGYLLKEDLNFINKEWSCALLQKVDNLKKIFKNEKLIEILYDFVVLKTNEFNFNYFLKTIGSWVDKGIITTEKAKGYLFEKDFQQLHKNKNLVNLKEKQQQKKETKKKEKQKEKELTQGFG